MATTPFSPDLTPFGFTPTENLVYFRLLSRGPSSGYAIARELSMARANVYQALRGLTSKGAALLVGDRPQRFRAIRPDGLYAKIVEQEARKLDDLEAQLGSAPESAAETLVPLGSERALIDLATRILVRETREVSCLAPAALLGALVPALRKRAADGAPTALWCVGDPPQLPVPIGGLVEASRLERLLGSNAAILLAGDAALLGRHQPREAHGFWATDPLVVGVVRAAMVALTAPEPA